ncbi:uncharacterized protein [Apostichopus japonicus]|uniref:uncharacterized protein isoform X2 n=1 Tax=Stichopus japonicus TaxID=307972 RepID=UPI003AB5A05C
MAASQGDDEDVSGDGEESSTLLSQPEVVCVEEEECDDTEEQVEVNENQIVTASSIPTFRHVLLKETELNSDKPNCRICQGTKNGKGKLKLVAPCACKGSSEYVHKKCLRKWCATKRSTECEICNRPYHPRYLKAPRMPKSDEDSLVSSTMLLFLLIGVFAVSVYLLIAHLYAVQFAFTGDCWLLLFLVVASLCGLLTFLGWFARNFQRISKSRKEQLRLAHQLVPLNTVTADPVSTV